MARLRLSSKLLLGFDNISVFGVVSVSQTLPLVVIPAILSLRLGSKIKLPLLIECFFISYGLLVSVVNFVQSDAYAMEGLIRQAFSYGLGLVIFSYLLRTFDPRDFSTIICWINQLAYLLFLMVIAQLYITDGRPTGLSSEPSHLGDVICLLLLPLLLVTRQKNPQFWLVLTLLLLSLLATQSLTSYLKLLTLLLGVLIFLRPILVLPIIGVSGWLIAWAWASSIDNYAFNMLDNDLNALYALNVLGLSGSFLDRFIGPVLLLTSGVTPGLLLGGGLGCELACFFPLAEPEIAEVIMSVKAYPPTLSPYLIKTVFYFGVVPTLLLSVYYLLILVRKWRSLSGIEKGILIAVLVASSYSIGPYWLPYVWIWKTYLIKK